jgi:hypothetical protein
VDTNKPVDTGGPFTGTTVENAFGKGYFEWPQPASVVVREITKQITLSVFAFVAGCSLAEFL